MDNVNSLKVVNNNDLTAKKVLLLVVCILVPIGVGALAGYITRNNMVVFNSIKKPSLTPPAIVFPIAWSILYVLMGLGSFFAIINSHDKQQAVYVMYPYVIQLVLNFIWSIIFFNYSMYGMAFVCIVFLWIMILRTMVFWSNVSDISTIMMMPYIVWVTFAAYLNLSIVMLNR